MKGESRPGYLPFKWLFGGVMAVVVAGLFSLLSGPIDIATGDVVKEVLDRLPGVSIDTGLTELQSAILIDVRLPRVVLGLIAGGTLAGAGGA